MGVGLKAPVTFDCVARLEQLVKAYHTWLERTEASLPFGEKLRRRASMIYRSKGERRQLAGYYEADFTIDSRRWGGTSRSASERRRCTPWRPAERASAVEPGAASGE